MKRNTSAWLTGSRGFIGKHLIQGLKKNSIDYKCFSNKRSMENTENDLFYMDYSSKDNINTYIQEFGCPYSFIHLGWGDMTSPMSGLHLTDNVRDAKNAIDSTYYYPKGNRGVGLTKASNFGYNFTKYIKKESKKIKLILQIESIEGINNLEKILNLKNISGTLLGPYDLSSSLGVIGKLNNPLVLKAIKKYEKISKEKRVPMGIHIAQPNLNSIKIAHKKKYKFIASGTDMIFLGNSCKDFLKKISK